MADRTIQELMASGMLDKKSSTAKWNSVFDIVHEWMIQNVYLDYEEEG